MLCEIDGFAKNVTFDRNTHLLQDDLIELKKLRLKSRLLAHMLIKVVQFSISRLIRTHNYMYIQFQSINLNLKY